MFHPLFFIAQSLEFQLSEIDDMKEFKMTWCVLRFECSAILINKNNSQGEIL